MVLNRVKGRFVHRRHPRTVMLLRIPLDMDRHRHRSYTWWEVVQPNHTDAQPVCNIMSIGQSGGQSAEPDTVIQGHRNVTHTRHDHLKDRSTVLTQQVDLVDDHQSHLGHIVPVLPVPGNSVPLFRRGHNHVRLGQRADVRGEIPRQLHNRPPELAADAFSPIKHSLAGQGFQWSDVDCLHARVLVEQTEEAQLRDNGLTGPRWSTHEHIVIAVVADMEALRLYRVEMREVVELLVRVILQARLAEWSQIQQPGVSGLAVGQQQVGHREGLLEAHSNPAV
mmetsp:Transcript_21833/g.53129  ORF Transcript_21833/g.53129 Transcript_21833/m.53129 type:complete len:280 (-) Transcript_21833:93-932(-)